MIAKMKSYLVNIGVYENEMVGLDEDELCELAIHYLTPDDLSDFIQTVNN